ncbi:uncharacterized protein [Rutidosis leptorrhynchoides]|uniref:uncharacterized protein n=1 Tax=Rutidosis leptorrhynchoides TaxID=125765 RepID=UPI003A999956
MGQMGYVVKLKGRSIWDMQMENSDSWGWRQLLALRDKEKPHVAHVIGNGINTSVWFDNWSSIGYLDQMVTRRDRFQARMGDNLKVAHIILDNQWKWPDEWRLKYPALYSIDVPVLTNQDDAIVWVSNDGKRSKYNTDQVWNDLSENKPKVKWHRVIWFPQATPKHAFISCLAVQNRLVTQDKLQKWYPTLRLNSALCDQEVDSHEHLFFRCIFAAKVWNLLKRKLLFKGLSNNLYRIIDLLSAYPFSKNIWSVINRTVVAAMVYYIWQERNWRIFKGKKRSVQDLRGTIEQFVRVKLLTFKVKRSAAVIKAGELWDLTWDNMQFQWNGFGPGLYLYGFNNKVFPFAVKKGEVTKEYMLIRPDSNLDTNCNEVGIVLRM